MRGKAANAGLIILRGRITPAHAGKSSQVMDVLEKQKDHPRACGEKSITPSGPQQPAGSPPRMRGEVLMDHKTYKDYGITPAHAGRR